VYFQHKEVKEINTVVSGSSIKELSRSTLAWGCSSRLAAGQ
jgi:hypothetical protein